jgi:hypothetical protein
VAENLSRKGVERGLLARVIGIFHEMDELLPLARSRGAILDLPVPKSRLFKGPLKSVAAN